MAFINKSLLILKIHYFLYQAGLAPSQTSLPVYAQTLGFSGFVVGTVYTVLPLTGLFIKPALGALADRFKWHKVVMLASEILILTCYFSIQFIPSAFSSNLSNQTATPTPHLQFCNENVDLFVCTSNAMGNYMRAESKVMNNTSVCSMNCSLKEDIRNNLCSFTKAQQFCLLNITSSPLNLIPDSPSYLKKDICEPFSMPFADFKNYSPFCSAESNCISDCGEQGFSSKDWQQSLDDSVVFSQYQIYIFILLMIGAWGGGAAANTLSDTICIAKSGDWSLYGRQRLWGSIGYGVTAIINGIIIDAISVPGQNKNYTPVFYISLAMLLIDVVVSYFYIEVKIPQKSHNITRDVWKTFLNPRILIFLVWCAAMGASMGVQWTFLFWMLEELASKSDTVSSIKTIEGLVNGVQTFIGEVPAFFFAYIVLNKIGHGHCISLIFFIVGIRYVCYSLLVNPWYVLLIEPLQMYFGLFYSTMTSYASIVAPPGTEATVQSLMCAFVEGIGVAIGSFVGGILVDGYGTSITFRIFGIAFLIIAFINEGIEFIFKMNKPKEQPVMQESTE